MVEAAEAVVGCRERSYDGDASGICRTVALEAAVGGRAWEIGRRPVAVGPAGRREQPISTPEYGVAMRSRTPRLSERQRQLVSQRARRRVAQLASPLGQKTSPDNEPSLEQPQGGELVSEQPPYDEQLAVNDSQTSGWRSAASAKQQANELPVILEGPRGHRHPLVLREQDGLAAVLSEAGSVGVPPYDAVVWLKEPPGQTLVQLAFVGRASARVRVVGAASLASAAGLKPNTTLYVRSRTDNSTVSGVDRPPNNEQVPEPPQRRECRICAMGDDEDELAAGDRLIAPCACKGTVKFVHVSCLQEWRRRNMAQSRFCSVCSEPYNCIRDANTRDYLSHYCGQLLRSPCSSVGKVALKFVQHAFVDRCNVHLACLLTRILSALVLLWACAVLGRLLTSVTSEFVHSVLVMDEVLDKLFLPTSLVNMMNTAFPSLPYVLSSATTAAATVNPSHDETALVQTQQLTPELHPAVNGSGMLASASAAVDLCVEVLLRFTAGILNTEPSNNQTATENTAGASLARRIQSYSSNEFVFAGAFVEVHNQWLQWSMLSLSMGWEDVIVAVLTWSVLLSWARRVGDSGSAFGQRLRTLLPWLQSPITLLSDLSNLVHIMFPSMLAVVHGLTLLLPTSAYLVRRWLHAVGIVELHNPQLVVDFGTGENLGLHILMLLGAITVVANGFGALVFVYRHHHEWRVNNSYIA